MKYCNNCRTIHNDSENYCPSCGQPLVEAIQTPPPPRGYYEAPGNNAFDSSGPEGKSRGVAALLAILLGYLGIHYFYLGKTTGGIICILLSAITCGAWQIITLIQGIMMFCMTNEEFEKKFVQSPSAFPLF